MKSILINSGYMTRTENNQFIVHPNIANKHRFVVFLIRPKSNSYSNHYVYFWYREICDMLGITAKQYEEKAKEYGGKLSYNHELRLYDVDFPDRKSTKRFIEEWLNLYLFFLD